MSTAFKMYVQIKGEELLTWTFSFCSANRVNMFSKEGEYDSGTGSSLEEWKTDWSWQDIK